MTINLSVELGDVEVFKMFFYKILKIHSILHGYNIIIHRCNSESNVNKIYIIDNQIRLLKIKRGFKGL